MDGNPNSGRLVPFREEANAGQSLFGRQEACLHKIRDYVDALARERYQPLKESAWADHSFRELLLDRERNQTILIDGSRGSGKTTLLVQLTKRWQDEEESAQSNIVPLRIVDLEIAPGGSSLLLQVSQALRFVSSGMADAHDSAESRAWNKWKRFVRIAATTGVGGIDTRRPNLDLESFAYELEESLPGFLDIQRTFFQFMDLLVQEYRDRARKTSPHQWPLFVVGIDDADMSPHRSAELLEVTRVLRHPRLVFVLTGDIDLFRAALHAHYLSLLRAPLQHRKFSEKEMERLDDFTRAAQLGEDMLDKALPAHQRFRIDDVDPEFGLRFLRGDKLKEFTFPALARGLKAPDAQMLADESPSIYHYLENDALANRLLYRSIRILGDLGGVIDRVGEHSTDRIPRLLCDLWNIGLNKSGIAAQDKAILREAVRIETASSSEGKAKASEVALAVDPGCVDWEQVRAYDRSLVYPDHTWLDCHLIRTTGLRARVRSQREDVPGTLLSPVAAGVLMLATDITADHKIWRIGRAPAIGSRAVSLVEVGLRHEGLTLRLPWPTPDWPAFIDHAALVQRWDKYLERFREEAEAENLLSLAFQATYIIAGVAEHRFSAMEDVRHVGGEEMRTRLHGLIKSKALPERQVLDATRDNAIRRWMQSLWLLVCPEYGLGREERDQWRKALPRVPKFPGEDKEVIRDLRIRALLQALRQIDQSYLVETAQEIIGEIDGREAAANTSSS